MSADTGKAHNKKQFRHRGSRTNHQPRGDSHRGLHPRQPTAAEGNAAFGPNRISQCSVRPLSGTGRDHQVQVPTATPE